MLRIQINTLKAGLHRFSLDPAPQEVDLEPGRFADIHVDATLDYAVDRILVTLVARATATLECDRTLQLFDQQIEGTYHLLFASSDLVARGSEEQGAFEDVRVLAPADHEIDLTDAVRDTLLLAIPTRCLAPGAEDMEIPTRFGLPAEGEAEIDPRWEALRKLRSAGEDTP